MTPQQFKDLRKLVSFAKRQKISEIEIKGVKIKFHDKAFVSKLEKKAFSNLLNPSSQSKNEEEEFRNDLFWSA
jgi:hypothetical protein